MKKVFVDVIILPNARYFYLAPLVDEFFPYQDCNNKSKSFKMGKLHNVIYGRGLENLTS